MNAVPVIPFAAVIDEWAEKYERGECTMREAFNAARVACGSASFNTSTYLLARFDQADAKVAASPRATGSTPESKVVEASTPTAVEPPAVAIAQEAESRGVDACIPSTAAPPAVAIAPGNAPFAGGKFYSLKEAAPLRAQTVDALRAEIRRSVQERVGNDVRVDLGGGWFAIRNVSKRVWRVWIPVGGMA